MANDKIEFDIVVNGKKAVDSIEDVEKAQTDLDKTTTKTTKNITTNWKAVGAAAAAAAVAIGAMMKQSIELERALFGLNKETREWIRNASEQYGMSQNLIAGFVQTGKAAGVAGGDIASIIDQAVALGRAFPHESTEAFVENLIMLNRTGEAQGYIVDILEQKYGQMDLKTLSLAQQQQALADVVKGVNEEFENTSASDYDQAMTELENTSSDLGDALMTLAEESGVLWVLNKLMDAGASAALGYAMALNRLAYGIKVVGNMDTSALDESFDKLVTQANKKTGDLFGTNEDGDIDMGTIDVGGGRDKPKISFTGGAASNEADKERSIALAANERFWDDYNATMMSGMEYELNALNEQFTEYNKYVTDKAALDEWYAAEQQRILDEHNFQMQAYADMQRSFTDSMIDGITEFAETGKLSFKEFAQSLIQDLARIQIAASMNAIMGGISSVMGGGSLGSTMGLFAKGDAFMNGKVTPFASGGIVSSPTIFPMANGMGLMGEAGAEAVMPLSRTSGGDLGVKATKPVVNVNVQNFGNDEVKVEQNGDNIDIIISRIAGDISRGTGNIGTAIEGRYGIRKQ